MVTIKNIAEAANVSIGTVDRVLHNRGEFSVKTEEKVRKVIKKLNYKPNVIARSLVSKKEIKFGVFLPKNMQDESYWKLPVNGIKTAERELGIYKVKIIYFYYDKYSETSFKKVFYKMLEKIEELEGLLIAPVISELASKLINKIPKNIPFVFIDSCVQNSNFLSFIGQNTLKSGALSAKLMSLSVKAPASIAVIRLISNDYHINNRIKGFLSYFKDFKDFKNHKNNKIVIYEPEEGKDLNNIVKKIVKENKDLKGIFVPSVFVGKITNLTKKKSFKIIGYDLTSKNEALVKSGAIDFLINQRPELQGYIGIITLFKKVVLKEEVKKEIMIPIDILTKENIEEYKDQI